MKVFLTGGSGFLGKVVIQHLKSAGHEVLALARTASAREKVEALGVHAVPGDLENTESMRPFLRDIEAVVHCAAPVEFWGPWKKFEVEIVEATINLARLADECGVRRFIHISSESVLQNRGALLDIDESFPYPAEPNSFYGKAKMLAERSLLASDFKMEVVILRPTFIWGSGCPALELIANKAKSGQFIWIDGGRAAFEAVHVENVAHAIVLALSAGKNKGVYFITDGASATVREFLGKSLQARQLEDPGRSIPGWLARIAACVIERLWRRLKLPGVPPLTKFDVAFVSQARRYLIVKAKAELGYSPVITRNEGFRRLLNAP